MVLYRLYNMNLKQTITPASTPNINFSYSFVVLNGCCWFVSVRKVASWSLGASRCVRLRVSVLVRLGA